MVRYGIVAVAAAAGLTALAIINRHLSARAEQENPPKGSFLETSGQRLHYLDQGKGPAIVLLHGNGSMVDDFLCSGLVDELAKKHRVVVFDRPGFGFSPASIDCSPEAQADLLEEALTQLEISEAIVLGHSWGTLVAIALGQRSKLRIKGLVLISGYYFATPRPDFVVGSVGAIPILGRILCETVLPLLARVTWEGAVRNLFAPKSRKTFSDFPKELTFRPSHLHSSAKETALLVPATAGLTEICRSLKMPIVLFAGTGDRVVDAKHSIRLQRAVPGSDVQVLPLQGHMLHHTARDRVVRALESFDSPTEEPFP